MDTTTLSTEDLRTLVHHARSGASDMVNQIIDEIIERATTEGS